MSDALLRRLHPASLEVTELARLFPERSSTALASLEWEIRCQNGRTRLARRYVGGARRLALREIVRVSGFERIRSSPAILLSFHFGAWPMLDPVLRWEGCESLVISSNQKREGGEVITRGSSLEARAAVVQRAVAHLRAGGRVMVAGDGLVGDTGFQVPVLGQRPTIRPGAAALARLSGVPVFPITAMWQGPRLHVEVHPPLALPESAGRDDFLERAAGVIGGWLDRHLRAAPDGLTRGLAHRLLNPS